MSLQVGKINGISGLFAPTNLKIGNVRPDNAATISGNVNCPVVKSDFAQEYFTKGYHTKANKLDVLA